MRIKKYLFVLFALATCTAGFSQAEPQGIDNPYNWKKIEITSPLQATEGAFIGEFNGHIIIAGGISLDGKYSKDIFALSLENRTWKKLVISLPVPTAYGVAINSKEGLVLIGGETEKGTSTEMLVLAQDISNEWELTKLMELPEPLDNLGACLLNNKIYIVGSIKPSVTTSSNKFYLLNVPDKSLVALPSLSTPISNNPVLIAQNTGESDAIYLYSKADNAFFSFTIASQTWDELKLPPDSMSELGGFKVGSAHIMYFNVRGNGKNSVKKTNAILYHTITRRWLPVQDFDIFPTKNGLLSNREQKILTTIENGQFSFYKGIPKKDATGLSFLDIFTFCVYFIVLLYMGYRFSKRIKNTDDYFRGGKRVPAWAAGISIVATKLSAVTFMSIPAKVFATDWLYFLIPFNSIVLAYFVVKVVLPFFQRLNLTSAYEYLEVRFNVIVRILGSISYLLWEIGRVGILLLLPAIVISVVTNIDLYFCILLIGFVATIYTMIGGIEAVIWTDVIQVFVMMVGILIALFIMVNRTEGSFIELVASADSQGKLKAFDWDLDLTRATVLVIVLGWLGRIQEYVSTQSIVQRFMTTENEKAAAKSMWISALVSIPVVIIFYFVGTSLFLYYQEFPQDLNPTMAHTDAILPTFFITQLPVGVIGLVIAAIFAAAMSSLDSAMNSMSTVIITDFYKRFKPKMAEAKLFTIAKFLVGILGILGTGSAILMASFEIKSLFDQLLLFMGLTGGGLAGVFLLGMLTNRASSYGVLIGFAASCFIQYFISFHTNLHFLLYSTTGLVSCYAIGYFVSLIFPDKKANKKKLNIYALNRNGLS